MTIGLDFHSLALWHGRRAPAQSLTGCSRWAGVGLRSAQSDLLTTHYALQGNAERSRDFRDRKPERLDDLASD